MGKWLSLIIGIVLAGLGLVGIIVWWSAGVWAFIRAAIVLALFFTGVGVTIFAIGDLKTPAESQPSKDKAAQDEQG